MYASQRAHGWRVVGTWKHVGNDSLEEDADPIPGHAGVERLVAGTLEVELKAEAVNVISDRGPQVLHDEERTDRHEVFGRPFAGRVVRISHLGSVPHSLDAAEFCAGERQLVDVWKREPPPELVRELPVQRIQHEGQEIPVRGEDHLRTDVTLRNGSHDSEPPDLSSNVRLSSTRRVIRSTPGLPKQRLEFLRRHGRKLALSKVRHDLRTKTKATCQRLDRLNRPPGRTCIDRRNRPGGQSLRHYVGSFDAIARQWTTLVLTPFGMRVTKQVDRRFRLHRTSGCSGVLCRHSG